MLTELWCLLWCACDGAASCVQGEDAEQQHSSPLDKLQEKHDMYAQQIEQIRQELEGTL